MALRASPKAQKNGFERQEDVRKILAEHHHPDWVDTRSLLKPQPGENINLLERRAGDLTNTTTGHRMEVQTVETPSDHVSWKRSKYRESTAQWQCFVYELKNGKMFALVIETDVLKDNLGPLDKIDWVTSDRNGNSIRDPFVNLWHVALRKMGAIGLMEWCQKHRQNV